MVAQPAIADRAIGWRRVAGGGRRRGLVRLDLAASNTSDDLDGSPCRVRLRASPWMDQAVRAGLLLRLDPHGATASFPAGPFPLRRFLGGPFLPARLQGHRPWDRFPGGCFPTARGGAAPHQIIELTESFFFAFVGLQAVTAFLLTPATIAGAIAEERQRRTLEFLLATDLQSREIIFGTLASRLAGLVLVLMGGLPILSLMQFLGGVDPSLLLGVFAATVLSVVSLGCLSIFNSVVMRRPLEAIVVTYLEVFAYLSLSFGFQRLLPITSRALMALFPGFPVPDLSNFPSTADWTSPVTVQDLANWLSAGNIGSATFDLGSRWPAAHLQARCCPACWKDMPGFMGCSRSFA